MLDDEMDNPDSVFAYREGETTSQRFEVPFSIIKKCAVYTKRADDVIALLMIAAENDIRTNERKKERKQEPELYSKMAGRVMDSAKINPESPVLKAANYSGDVGKVGFWN